MRKAVVMAVFAIVTLSVVSCGEKVSKDTTTEQTVKEPKEVSNQQLAYQCPMDCEDGKTYDKPGKCPVCEMDLVEVQIEKAE